MTIQDFLRCFSILTFKINNILIFHHCSGSKENIHYIHLFQLTSAKPPLLLNVFEALQGSVISEPMFTDCQVPTFGCR